MSTIQSEDAALLLLGKKVIRVQNVRVTWVAFDDPVLDSNAEGCRGICPLWRNRCTNVSSAQGYISCGGGYFIDPAKYLELKK